MRRRVLLLVTITLVSMLVSTRLFYHFEQAHNPAVKTVWDALYWWGVTAGSVGYGDVVPVTGAGRAVAVFAIMTGFFVFANVIALMAESLHAYLDRRERGKVKLAVRDHIVICEYTSVADEFVQAIPQCPEFAGRPVVIVSDLVERNPYPKHYFVGNVPVSPSALRYAGIEHAAYVFIFANLRFADPDVKALHTVSRVRRMNPDVRVFVELIDPETDLLHDAPPGLVPMDSRELLRIILAGRPLDAWLHQTLQDLSGGAEAGA